MWFTYFQIVFLGLFAIGGLVYIVFDNTDFIQVFERFKRRVRVWKWVCRKVVV
jgi:hypothetical protein